MTEVGDVGGADDVPKPRTLDLGAIRDTPSPWMRQIQTVVGGRSNAAQSGTTSRPGCARFSGPRVIDTGSGDEIEVESTGVQCEALR